MFFIKNSSDIFNGIFAYLRQNNPDEIFKQLIRTDASSVYPARGGPNVVFDPFVTGNNHMDNCVSDNVEIEWEYKGYDRKT